MKLLNMSLSGLIVLASLFACTTDNLGDFESFDPRAQLELDRQAIKAYVAENHPNALEDSVSGIWYELLNVSGVPDSATFTYKTNPDYSLIFPTVTANYEVMLLNGTKVDSNDKPEGFTSSLRTLIPAWQIAFFPQRINQQPVGGLTQKGLQVGDEIRFITPSAYAYGNRPTGNIPANSPLIFKLKVLKIVD